MKILKTLLMPMGLVDENTIESVFARRSRSNLNQNRLLRRCTPRNDGKRKSAFTTAEVIIVLVAIGIITLLTIPNLITNINDKKNVTKVRDAISTYEQLVSKIKVDEFIKIVGDSTSTDSNTLVGFVKNDSDCSNGKKYFKIKEDISGECKFKTYDNVWWNISDISKTIISLTDECKNSTPTTNKNDTCYNKVFYLTTEQDENSSTAFDINNEDGDAYYTLVFAKIIEAKTPEEIALKNFMKNTGYKCSCTGTNCCSSSCSGQACVQKDTKCTTVFNEYITDWKNIINTKASCTAYSLWDNKNQQTGLLEINDNVIAYRIYNPYSSTKPRNILKITKNSDGTYTYWDSGDYTGPWIRYIKYDNNWNPTKFQSYTPDVYICTEDSCNYPTSKGVNFNILAEKYKYGSNSTLDSLGTGAFAKSMMFYFAEELWK